MMVLIWGRNDRRLTVLSGFSLLCLSVCLASFVVLFCSVQYIEEHHGKRSAQFIITAQLEQDERLYMKHLVKENKELRETAELLRSGIRSSNQIRGRQYLSEDVLGEWRERSLKNVRIGASSQRLTLDKILTCKEIGGIDVGQELGRGYTKITQVGVHNGGKVAIKSAALGSTDVQRCVEEKRMKQSQDCMLFSRYKIMKELLLYQQLHHFNIVTLLGYCMQNDRDSEDIKIRGLTVVTELGVPLDMMILLQMPWHQRFRIAVGLSRLIHFFANSPLGSLVIHDFQITQFVLVNGDIKLSDLDDVDNEPQYCHSSKDCRIGNEIYNITLKCSKGQCQDFNAKWNIYNLYRFYLKTFLIPGAPEHLVDGLKNVETQTGLLNIDSKMLKDSLEGILIKLRNGKGRNTTGNDKIKYNVFPQADYPGRHDYMCTESWSSANCQLMAFNEVEAKQKCNEDDNCKAFVMSYDKTWTGYKYIFLKNGSSQMTYSPNNMVYVKIT